MAVYYKADCDQMYKAAEDMAEIQKKVETELTELQTFADQAMSLWDGEDREQYRICKNEWNQMETEMNNVLVKAGEAVNRICSNIKAGEGRIQGMWDKSPTQV